MGLLILGRGLDHDLGHHPERRLPLRFQLGGPVGAGEVAQGGDQARADGPEVVGNRAELAVIPAEALQERHQRIEVVRLRHDPGQGRDKPVTRDVHPHREEFPDLRMTQEEIGEKEQGHLVAMHHDARQIIPQPLGVH